MIQKKKTSRFARILNMPRMMGGVLRSAFGDPNAWEPSIRRF
jgi:hypothetical protein